MRNNSKKLHWSAKTIGLWSRIQILRGRRFKGKGALSIARLRRHATETRPARMREAQEARQRRKEAAKQVTIN